jgi:hypothetical protein
MTDNPNNKHILCKAYVLNSKESEMKTKLHLLFDNPKLRPYVFPTYAQAYQWLNKIVERYNY